ncbi:MAG TPA: MFS transporter [Actinomycetota bacterium]|nr:MFS transporter [Actinomycetota bacterium]
MSTERRHARFQQVRALARPGPFRRLIATQALSQAGDGLYQIALASLLIFSVEAARTPAQVTKVLAVTYLPFSLIGPFTGPFIDRFSRRSILVGSKVLMAAVTLVMIPARSWPEGILLVLVVVNVSINRFFHSTKNAVLPSLVDPERYLVANAVSTTTGMIFALGGAVIGGLLVDAISPVVGLGAGAACMLASALFASTLALPRGEKRGLAGIVSELRDNLRDVREGVKVLRRSAQATYGVVAIWSMRALLGLVLLAALVLLRAEFDIGAAGFSQIFAALAVGGFAGALIVTPAARRLGYRGVAPVAIAVGSVAALIGAPIPSMLALLPAMFVEGVAMSATKIASDTLVQRGIPDRFRGRAFTVYDLGYNGAFVLAGLIPTALRPALGDLGMILLTAALGLLTAGALALWRRRIPEPVEVRSYAGARGDEVPRQVVLGGATLEVDEVERSWQEDRDGEQLRCFRLRLRDGRRIQVSLGETWRLDRELAR